VKHPSRSFFIVEFAGMRCRQPLRLVLTVEIDLAGSKDYVETEKQEEQKPKRVKMSSGRMMVKMWMLKKCGSLRQPRSPATAPASSRPVYRRLIFLN